MSQENILYGPPEIEVEDPEKTLAEYFFESLSTGENRTFQVDAKTGRSHTNRDILSLSLRLAENLRYGIGRKKWHVGCGHCVCIFSENSIDYCIPLLAAFFVGAAAAPLNIHYSKGEISHAINISKPKVIFASKSKLNELISVARTTDFVQAVVVMDEIVKDAHHRPMRDSKHDDFIISINDLLYPEEKFASSLPLEKDFPKLNIKEHVALLLCSSGTTGLPKVVMLTQFNIIYWLTLINVEMVRDNKWTVLSLLPYFHSMGLMALLRSIFAGLETIVISHFEKKLYLETIEKYKVSSTAMVPPLALFLTKDPMVAKYDLSSISMLGLGAAPLGKDIQQKLESLINKGRARIGAPPCRVIQGYGLTEATIGIAFDRGENIRPGSVGTVLPGLKCKIVDLETGKSMGANQRGEIWVQGPMTMKGYLNDPKSTSEVIDKNGWLHTGDIGYYDDEGYIYIVDRIKEIIKYKGYQVAPAELEDIIHAHPSVEDVAVIGIPNEEAGEVPMALIVKKQGKELSEAEVIRFVADQVSPQKRLRGGVKFVQTIPKTQTGKILRRVLKESLKSKL